MLVKNIIRNCAVLLDDETLLSEIDADQTLSTQNQSIVKKLVECVNIINRKIALSYISLKDKLVLNSNYNTINISDKTNKEIVEILSVYVNNSKGDFSFENGVLVTENVGVMTITYTYLPKTLVYSDNISYYYNKLDESVFAYGVVSEYLYIMGNVTDAKMWEEKFVSSISGAQRRKKDVLMPQRRWY